MRNLGCIALGYRALATLVAVAGVAGSSTLSAGDLRSLVLVAATVLGAHAVALVVGRRGRLPSARSWVVVADVAIAAGLNVWASALVPEGSLFYDYGNPFSGYAVATVALWTGGKGARLGRWLVAAGAVPLQVIMAAVNGTSPSDIDLARFVTRALWFVIAYALARLLLDALGRGAEALVAESERAGRETRREEMLRDLHNGVLQALLGMEVRAAATARDGDRRAGLQGIAADAQRWSARVGGRLGAEEDHWTGLVAEMESAVEAVGQRGRVRPELRVGGAEPQLDAPVGRALLGATVEAVQNAERHSNATVVTVTVTDGESDVRVVVADDGDGLPEPGPGAGGYGISNSIEAALRSVGGRAEMATSPGRGLSWELTVPRHRHPASVVLAERTILDLAVVCVWYRLLGLAISAAGLVGSRSLGPVTVGPLLAVIAVVALSQIAVIRLVTGRANPPDRSVRQRVRPASAWLAVADIAVAVALNLWAAAAVPTGTLFLDYRNPFGLYAQASLAIWGSVKRWTVGFGLLVFMALPLQLAMTMLNGTSLAAVDWPKLVSRALWLVPALLLAKFVMSVAREGAILLADEGHRSGLAAERSRVLAELHAAVLPGLDAIADCARAGDNSDRALAEIGMHARTEVARIRSTLRMTRPANGGCWHGLESLVGRIEGEAAVRVELVCRGSEPTVEPDDYRAVLEVVEGILGRAAADGPCRATVFAETGPSGLRVVVRHDGSAATGIGRAALAGRAIRSSVSVTSDGGERWELNGGWSGPEAPDGQSGTTLAAPRTGRR